MLYSRCFLSEQLLLLFQVRWLLLVALRGVESCGALPVGCCVTSSCYLPDPASNSFGSRAILALVGMARLRGLVIPALLVGLMAIAFSMMRDQSVEYMRIRLLEDTAPWVPSWRFSVLRKLSEGY